MHLVAGLALLVMAAVYASPLFRPWPRRPSILVVPYIAACIAMAGLGVAIALA